MKSLKTFWYSFRRSLTDPEYYSDIMKSSFAFSLKYLFCLVLIILLVRALLFSVSLSTVFPKLPQYVGQVRIAMSELYPKELVLTLNNGSLRTNVDEPYIINFPKSMNIKEGHLAVINTKSSIEEIEKYNTLFYVTKNAIAYPDSNSSSGYRVQMLTDMKGYTVINRQAYDRFLLAINPYLDYAPVLIAGLILSALILFPLFGSIFFLSGILFYLLILTFLAYIMASLLKKNLNYWTLYRLSMHGITFSLLFDFFKSFFNVSIPFTFVMPYLIWMLIVFNSLKTTHGTHPSPSRSSK